MRSWLSTITSWALVGVALQGCGDDSSDRPIGPEITFIGVTRADDSLVESAGENSDGVPIFVRPKTINEGGSGFSIVVEGKPGSSGSDVGTSSYDPTLNQLPDLQVVVSRPLGNGSVVVCDDPLEAPGGVPAVEPASFDETDDAVRRAANDLGCRFVDGGGETAARTNPSDSCVSFPSGDFSFVEEDSTAQYCGFVNVPLAFPVGDTLVTARLRDAAGNVGPEAHIVVRVQ